MFWVALQEAQNRSAAEGGAAEAGQRAVAELSMNLAAEEAEETLLDPRSAAASLAPQPHSGPQLLPESATAMHQTPKTGTSQVDTGVLPSLQLDAARARER